ncbi:MAG: alpha/beta hydrolase, partial [Candidatus Thorarchaeota archaeon]
MNIQFGHPDGKLTGVALRGSNYPRKGVLLLHPHPLYGGDMNSHVIRALEDALSHGGFTTLRFDFRGVHPSDGAYTGLAGAIIDATSALAFLREELSIDQLGLIGYSFGGSTALGLAQNTELDFLVTISASLAILKESELD